MTYCTYEHTVMTSTTANALILWCNNSRLSRSKPPFPTKCIIHRPDQVSFNAYHIASQVHYRSQVIEP